MDADDILFGVPWFRVHATTTKKAEYRLDFFRGGLTYTFLKPQPTDDLIQDLILLYTRLVDIGMEYRNGKVYFADLEEKGV